MDHEEDGGLGERTEELVDFIDRWKFLSEEAVGEGVSVPAEREVDGESLTLRQLSLPLSLSLDMPEN